ncbi:MAG TPA: mechanosensitive ion channel family protein [Terriglobales bacterium]|jgi:moderate conductance mechanosensitive channel|nr:mechanosensitive ion channel family protein [Terriglobales bacterium]
MEDKFSNILSAWHNYLVTWTRDRAPKLVVILFLAFLFIRLLRLVTRKVVAFSERGRERGPGRAQQIRTMVAVVRSIGVFLIFFFTGVYVLKEALNIDVAPLLASAGVAGLAIGFGAQTLVKDVINGFFILAENQFEIGDVIKAAGVSGTVEDITMRRTVLRDPDGTLHTVPNGAIQIVSNTTRDWSQVSLQVTVDYSEDSDRVLKLLKEVAAEIFNDEQFRPFLVAEPEPHGIERIRGQEVDYLVTAKARPGKQYALAREMRRRIKTSFEQNKIKAGSPLPLWTGPHAGSQ